MIEPTQKSEEKSSARKSARNLEKSQEIDFRNFSLGDGPWKVKRERIGRLIDNLVENKDQYQEFKIRTIKSKPRTDQKLKE